MMKSRGIFKTKESISRIVRGSILGLASLFLACFVFYFLVYWTVEFELATEGIIEAILAVPISFLILFPFFFPEAFTKQTPKSEIRLRATVLAGILSTLLLTLYIWRRAYFYFDDYYLWIDASKLAITLTVLINGFFFASAFLLVKLFRKTDDSN